MLQAVENLLPNDKPTQEHRLMDSSVLQNLRIHIDEWRALRQCKYGTRFSVYIALLLTVFAGEVLAGVCTEKALQNLQKQLNRSEE